MYKGLPKCIDDRHSERHFGRKDKYRAKLGGKSSTCCLPAGSTVTAHQIRHDHFQDKPNQVPRIDPQIPKEYDQNRDNYIGCFHQQFGITKQCKAEFDIKVLKCTNPSKCTTADGQVRMIRLLTTHRLLTKEPGCLPWFALADTGMRRWVTYVRKHLVAQHADPNTLASSTATTATVTAKPEQQAIIQAASGLEDIARVLAALIVSREEDAGLRAALEMP